MSIADVVKAVQATLRRQVVYVVEPTSGPWVGNNFWGDQVNQPLPHAANQTLQVLPKNTRFFGPPRVHTVQLARGDETPPVNADVRAVISYGCGGVRNSFSCDWLHGVQIPLVCNTIDVVAVTYAPRAGAPYDAGTGAVFLGAAVAEGAASASAPATYTENRVTMAAAEVDDYPVRDFVREVTVHIPNNNDPSVAQTVAVEFLDAGGGSNATYDAQVFARGNRVPIPGMTNTLRIRNNSGGVKQTTVQWFLGF